jgi:hypothetical protein
MQSHVARNEFYVDEENKEKEKVLYKKNVCLPRSGFEAAFS